ncbi:MAG: class I SAM-dependent methyltransferase [Flavobacteriales bacterium]|nr:class I SAM-dependent methyltransferase [Flavobacteriales bacterium]
MRSEPLYANSLLRCNGCRFITANCHLSDGELRRLYSHNYFHGEEYLDYLSEKNSLQENFRRRLAGIPIRPGDRVLEIGCAYGFFGELVKRLHHGAVHYKGIDIATGAVAHGRSELGLDLIDGDYLRTDFPEPFTHIFLWDVVEHLQRPDLVLKKAASELAPGGRLYLTTGDVGALLPRIQGRRWRMIHPPTHLHYFSAQTMSVMLREQGLEVKRISHPTIYRSWKQIYYSLFLLGKDSPSAFHRWVFDRIPEGRYIGINTRDIMLVEAHRP